ncbi:HAD-IA family hydrolase [Roseibium sp.]|uniref:HAD-IA family hydrolase n=1 Tax=Roseibium sp. TaxID=1936156 RepID=UPI003B522E4E
MREDIKAVAWDFDGVLNRNMADGRFVWADSIEADLGIKLDHFQSGVFDQRFLDVIRGRVDILDHLQDWLDETDYRITAPDLLSYWFVKDDLQDPMTGALLQKLNARGVLQVIATNNESRRAGYIEDVSGFRKAISYVFSSGRLGVVKPERAFFDCISTSLSVQPEHMLLIDDNASNVRSARALGWNTYHFTDETRDGLADYLGL